MITDIKELLSSMIPVGYVVKPHGLRGEVKFKLTTNLEDILEVGENALLFDEKSKRYVVTRITDFRKAGSGYILSFEGFDNVGLAERIRGYHLYIAKSKLPPLEKGEFYFYQVLEAQVFSPEGEYLGKVEDIIETGANDVFVVKHQLENLSVREILIPVIKDYILELDLDNKRVVAKIPDFEKENE